MKIVDKLVSGIRDFSDSYFQEKPYFGCVYGSHSDGTYSEKSDIDLFFAVPEYREADQEKLISFILQFHERYRLVIDDEVPHENKLLVTYDDISDAIRLRCFDVDDKGHYAIPAVVKSDVFLKSRNIKMRLLLNALTKPHIFFGNDQAKYEGLRKRAEHNLVLLAARLCEQDEFTQDDLLDVLMTGKNQEEEEMYLGYKKHSSVTGHLITLIHEQIVLFVQNGTVVQTEDGKLRLAPGIEIDSLITQ